MKIKDKGYRKTPLSVFDLFGYKETGLSKAFAYIISKDSTTLRTFLRMLGTKHSNYINTSIEIEKYRYEQGRTDIEIKSDNAHIIVECKVGSNKAFHQQINKYLKTLDASNKKNKILCLVTQGMGSNYAGKQGVKIINISWLDIVEMMKNSIKKNKLLDEFIYYFERGYKMKSVKEILIQDIGTKSEIERFIRCNIYRRDETFSNPLYFAPYFSAKGLKNSTLVREQGITHISEVLGVITMDISNIDKGYLQDKFKEFIKLKYFSNEDEKKLLNKWIKGIKIDIKKGKKQTFYFLDNPIKLKRALLKDSATGKGRGKDWISAMIPKNRTIPFSKFIEKINEFY